MDKENKYYVLIENLIKNHRKFQGYEAILDDIIDDVYLHSKSIINSVDDEQVIQSYLMKVISTSIITVPKKMGFNSGVKHRVIGNATPIMPKEEVQPIINEVVSEEENIKVENTVEDATENINIQPETDAEVRLQESLIIEETPDIETSDLETPDLETPDAPVEDIMTFGEELSVQKADPELVDKMINSINTASLLEQVTDAAETQVDDSDNYAYSDSEIYNNEIVDSTENFEPIGYAELSEEEHLDELSVEEMSVEDINDDEIIESNDNIQEESENDEIFELIQDTENINIDRNDASDDGIDIEEITLNEEVEDQNDNVEDYIADNLDTISDVEELNITSELDIPEEENVVEDADIDSSLAFVDEELPVEENLLEEAVQQDNDDTIEQSDEFSDIQTSDMFEQEDKFEQTEIEELGEELVLDENEELSNDIDGNADAQDLEEASELSASDALEEKLDIDAFDIGDNLSLDISTDNIIAEDIDNFNEDFEAPSLMEETSVEDDIQSENILQSYEGDGNISLDVNETSSEDINKTQDFKLIDYSAFNYIPEAKPEDVDVELISNKLINLHNYNPELQIIQIFDLKYKKKYTIEQIASELEIDKDDVVNVLNELVKLV